MKFTDLTSLINLLMISLLLSACSHNRPVSEVTSNTKKIIYVQHGHTAQLFKLGMHDAASFWSNAGGLVGAAASMVNIDSQTKSATIIQNLMQRNDLVGETSKAVHTALQNKFQKRFHNQKPIIVKNKSLKYNGDGDLFTGKSNADIAVIFSVISIELNAPPTMGNMLGDIVTLGLQDKDVAPIITANVSAYKKTGKPKHAELVWQIHCSTGAFSSPEEYTINEMQQDKGKAHSLFKHATQLLIDDCVENIMDSDS